MLDWSASGLLQVGFFELLTRERAALGELEGVKSASRERNIYASPRTGMTIEFNASLQNIDFDKVAVRMWGAAKFLNQDSGPIPLFTGMPYIAGRNRGSSDAPTSLKLLDYSTALDVPLGSHLAVVAGEAITTRVRALLLSVGATDAVITESSAQASTNMFFLATQTKRQVVNELLKSIGYSAVWADEWGRLRCEPYVAPGDRPILDDLGFIHGQTCTYKPQFTIEHDTYNVPNHAVVTVKTDEAYPPVVGEAWLPVDHPYSYQTRGFEIPHTESEVDISVQALPSDPTATDVQNYLAALKAGGDLYAARALQERAQPSRMFQVENRWRPFDLHQAARFEAPARGAQPSISTVVTVAKDTLRYTAGEPFQMTTNLLEVL